MCCFEGISIWDGIFTPGYVICLGVNICLVLIHENLDSRCMYAPKICKSIREMSAQK